MSLLRAPFFKNSHLLAKIYFIFLKTRPRSNFKGFLYQILTSVKSSYQAKQILSLLCKLVTLILDANYVKGLRVTKIVKPIKFERDWGNLEAKYCFQRESCPKCIRQTLVLV